MKEKIKNICNIKIDKIRINGTGFFICAMAYIYISIIIFLLGWIQPILSIPISIEILIALYMYYKKFKTNLENVEPIYISSKVFLFLIFVVLALGWILGWTGFAKQVGDWDKHNSVLCDLTRKRWPVFYQNKGENSMLTYYIGQYIVPATIGKIFFKEVRITMFINAIWAMLGLLIAIIGLFKVTKANSSKKQIIALIALLSFSVCTFLAQKLGNLFNIQGIANNEWFIYNSEYRLQFSSNMTLLRWVMPQVIVPWIVFSILYDNIYDIEHYVILCIPVLFYSSFSFMGLMCFLVILVIVYLVKTKDIKLVLKKIFSSSNIVTGILLGGIFITYFAGNILMEKSGDTGFKLVEYSGSNILIYICFIMTFLPYTIILFKDNKKNPVYWIATAILLILPFLWMGIYNDLCMRVSIIPLFVYNILTIKALIGEQKLVYRICIIIILLIGSVSSGKELYRTCKSMSLEYIAGKSYYTLEWCANRNLNIRSDMIYNYYTYDVEDSIFYEYLSKNKIE